ncbi:hypothetical protein JNO12_12580 [Erwinia aphidicola]|nr:hypothetical protein [Erwinia aphidicola]
MNDSLFYFGALRQKLGFVLRRLLSSPCVRRRYLPPPVKVIAIYRAGYRCINLPFLNILKSLSAQMLKPERNLVFIIPERFLF